MRSLIIPFKKLIENNLFTLDPNEYIKDICVQVEYPDRVLTITIDLINRPNLMTMK